MQVLVYFDEDEEHVARSTVAELAKQFQFSVDLLIRSAPVNLAVWQALSSEPVVVWQTRAPFEEAIRARCAERHYALVVTAPSDRRGILRLLLGSRLIRFAGAAPATIWVSRNHPRPLHRILVGISGAPQSEQDAQLAARLAVAYGAQLVLVHVVSQLPLLYTTPGEFQAALADAEQLAGLDPGARELQRIYQLLHDAGVQVELVVREGTVIDGLVAACAEQGEQPAADLLVIGAHASSNEGGTDYFVNLAEQITEAVACPTLVVHAQSDWAEWTMIPRVAP
jgi:nucleotide-binding universal stress UspA family protein